MNEVCIIQDIWTGQLRAFAVGKVPLDILLEVSKGSRYVMKIVPAACVLGYIISNALS